MDENDLGMVLRVGRNGIMDIHSFALVYGSKHQRRTISICLKIGSHKVSTLRLQDACRSL